MTTMTHETEIVADEKVPSVRMTREFDAPAAKVFRAHADPELFAQWIGPHDLETSIDHFDCRTGGAYRFVQRRGDDEFGFHGCFHEVRPNEVIVQTFTFEGVPDGVALQRAQFEELKDGRSRLTVTSLVGSFEERAAILASGMEHGVREGYEKLDALLRVTSRD
jgi:uncharacterized protein YndB with AHSA1/START domain